MSNQKHVMTIGMASGNLQRCKTFAALRKAVTRLQMEVANSQACRRAKLQVMNEDINFSGSGQHELQFEMNRVISDHYISEVKFCYSAGEFSVHASTRHMHDGAGMSSKNWEPAFADDEDLVTSKDDPISLVMEHTASKLIGEHAELLTRCGVAAVDAALIAKEKWGITSVH